jgi:hypothetical protein
MEKAKIRMAFESYASFFMVLPTAQGFLYFLLNSLSQRRALAKENPLGIKVIPNCLKDAGIPTPPSCSTNCYSHNKTFTA